MTIVSATVVEQPLTPSSFHTVKLGVGLLDAASSRAGALAPRQPAERNRRSDGLGKVPLHQGDEGRIGASGAPAGDAAEGGEMDETSQELGPRTAAMRICRACFGLYEEAGERPQLCSCRGGQGQERWSGYDYNEHTHLCECCLARVRRSGSRWSVWFCDPCKDLVRGVNQELGFTRIPLGRHTLMAGIGLQGPDSEKEAVARFTGAMLSLFDAMNHLHTWSRARLRFLMAQTGPWVDTPRLGDYLGRLASLAGSRRELSREASFEALFSHFGIELIAPNGAP